MASTALLRATTIALFLLGLSLAAAEVYKVGGSVGWTIIGSPNYTAWASTKTFHVGDTLLFEYNKKFHNVLQTSESDYSACKATSPLATYASGNDSISVNIVTGHLFFICGVPGHCTGGQKVDILVSKSTSSDAPSTSAMPPIPPSPAAVPSGDSGTGISVPAPTPKANHAPPTCKRLGFALLAMVGVAAISNLLIMA